MKKIISILLSIAILMSVMSMPVLALTSRDTSLEESIASDLKMLGLFKGVSETNFDLNREPSRTEALVMLIRFLGKDGEAINGKWNHPFTDVASWADKYVGYAYVNGLTNGVSSTKFGSGSANASMYLTFVLRALGYSDKNNMDFSWSNPYDIAGQIGILPDIVNTSKFLRSDVVSVSYAALSVNMKGSNQTMAGKLIDMGTFSSSQFELYYDNNAFNNNKVTTKNILTPKEIYDQCSSSVFYISTYDIDGNSFASGSGFFIAEGGIAVTNYHVLENAINASVTLTNGESYEIEGIIDYNEDMDYAIIKIKGYGFKPLKIGDSKLVSGGDTIYTIGNPLGLTNSISDGIVSNANRADINGMIQITAPISPGSSGGALIDIYGEVIGVTTSSLVRGQNLNFAIPINNVLENEDVYKYSINNNVLTMMEFSREVAYSQYENVPEAFEYRIDEIEPNDTYENAQVIDNGTSIWGVVDDEFLDEFLVHCNTVGTIDVMLFSQSQQEFVKDLILAVEPVNKKGEEGVGSDYLAFEDGSAGRKLKYVIPRPGVYSINILSNDLYNYYDISTDYSFYYKFTPGLTTGTNSGNKPDVNTIIKDDPIEIIKNYLLEEGEYDAEGNGYTLEMPANNDLYSISYYPRDSIIVLGSDWRTEDGLSLYTFIVFDRINNRYYYSVSIPSEDIEGTGLLTANTLSPDSVLNFDTYDGRSIDKSAFNKIAVLSLCGLVDATEYMFRYYEINTSIKELGFDYLESIYSQ